MAYLVPLVLGFEPRTSRLLINLTIRSSNRFSTLSSISQYIASGGQVHQSVGYNRPRATSKAWASPTSSLMINSPPNTKVAAKPLKQNLISIKHKKVIFALLLLKVENAFINSLMLLRCSNAKKGFFVKLIFTEDCGKSGVANADSDWHHGV